MSYRNKDGSFSIFVMDFAMYDECDVIGNKLPTDLPILVLLAGCRRKKGKAGMGSKDQSLGNSVAD